MNTNLQRFHRYAMSRLVWPLSIILGFAIAFGWQLAPDSFWTKILAPLTSAVAVGGTFLFLERTIRLHLWRIAYPEYDFSGVWKGGTQYNHRESNDQVDKNHFEPFEKEHHIKFKQDCLSVAVDYDETDDFHGWNSTVATIVSENGRVGLRYAYEVKYKKGLGHDARLPDSAKGLEEVFVVGHTEGRKPTKITGGFAHTIDAPWPRYRGDVSFVRLSAEPVQKWHIRLFCFFVTKLLKPPAEQ